MFSGSHHLSFSDNTFIDNSTTPDSCKDYRHHASIKFLLIDVFLSHEGLLAAYNNWSRVRFLSP
jgi:hypothetical protein